MLSKEESKKVEVFKDTYNAMYLKDMSQEKLNYIKSNSNPVQKQLIDNLKKITKPKHPYNIELIEGPTQIQKFELPRDQKTVYIFGETHRLTLGHCKTAKAVQFNNYIELLTRESPAFFDFYLETPMVKSKKNKLLSSSIIFNLAIEEMYQNPHMTLLNAYTKMRDAYLHNSPSTSGYMFRMIRNTLNKCFQPDLRHDDQCKLMRFHNVDLRSTWDWDINNLKIYGADVALSLLSIIFRLGKESTKAKIDMIKRVDNNFPFILKSLETLIANDKVNILDLFYTNKYFKKELDASYKKEEIEKWLVKMTSRILSNNIKIFVANVKNLLYSVRNDNPITLPYCIIKQLRNDFLLLNVLLLDGYCIARIFKLHNLKKHNPTGEFQPAESKNIIIYAGSIHSDNMAQFFYSIGFKPVYSYHNPDPNISCVNMKKQNNTNRNPPLNTPLKNPPFYTPLQSPAKPKPSDLQNLTVIQLRNLAKSMNLNGYSKLKKADLIHLIQNNQHKPPQSPKPPQAQPPKPPKPPKPPQAQHPKPPQAQHPKPPQAQPPSDIKKLTVIQLRNLAKSINLKGYSKFNKDDLINFIQNNRNSNLNK